MPDYTVTCTNASTNSGYIFIYQIDASLQAEYPEVRSVVWLAKYVYAGSDVVFHWVPEYSFHWSETDEQKQQPIVSGFGSSLTDLQTDNQVTLSFDPANHAYHFADRQPGTPGNLIIVEDESIPMRHAVIGFGMQGSPTFVLPAQPNTTLRFTPNPLYAIAFSPAAPPGMVLPATVTDAGPLDFVKHGTNSLKARLQRDNTWDIRRDLTATTRLVWSRPNRAE